MFPIQYRSHLALALCGLIVFLAGPSEARAQGKQNRAFRTEVKPNWLPGNTRFWYRNDLRGGAKEFVFVDAEKGTRATAFDHAKLAAALSKATGEEHTADKLPFDSIEFTEGLKSVRFKVGEKNWLCDLQSYALREEKRDEKPAEKSAAPRASAATRSARTGEETFVTFINRTQGEVELFWLNTDGGRRSYGKLASDAEHRQHTFAGHVWLAADAQGNELFRTEAAADMPRVEITRAPQAAQQQRTGQRQPSGQRTGQGFGGGGDATSPDRKWTALVKDNNLFIRGEDGKEIQLSTDGKEGLAYGRPTWSPDSKSLVAFRVEPAERKDVYLVHSSPPGGGRAKLQTRPYDLPGDKFAAYELNLFDVATRKQTKPDVERVDFGTPRIRWSKDGRHLSYQKIDRGHQRLRVVEVDSHTGATRNLIDEKSDTFIWTAHTENLGVPLVNWLEKSEEILYVSEKDGWRHLYLVDAKSAAMKPMTKGEWIIRGVERIDEDARQVWFRASGVFADQDPYLVHFGRVNFDGTGLVWLTAGHGNHTVQFSPDRKFIVDTFSRVDMAAANELRRVADGKLMCKLEEADTADLKASGWEAPEVFVAKARDGKTDIWGIITRPHGLDPAKKYPIIEDIYAGPQGSFVPKTFSTASRYESLNRLGFVVVKIDGMGTANRSKAFHDACFKNLKDAGFEDRILWMKAAAKNHPWMDVTRVGIYGTSAGGQNAAGAVLFHPEFYKAAVANCGCHDNRMDKASWNEQWMGYMPPEKLYSKDADNWYSASSNIDNAHRLRGALFLIVGELDTNVPPESTYRLVDALVKAGKDFDYLLVPNGGHGAGGQYAARRREDFFVRHLMAKEPPNRNAGP